MRKWMRDLLYSLLMMILSLNKLFYEEEKNDLMSFDSFSIYIDVGPKIIFHVITRSSLR